MEMSNQPQHTPDYISGPYLSDGDWRGSTIFQASTGRCIARMRDPHEAPTKLIPQVEAEMFATAKLFSAAPEMLEALKLAESILTPQAEAFLDGDDSFSDSYDTIRFVCAAIAKATGSDPTNGRQR